MSAALKETRKHSGKKQQEIAEKSKLSLRGYRYIENGEREPGVRTAIRIADALHIPVTDEFRKVFNDSPG